MPALRELQAAIGTAMLGGDEAPRRGRSRRTGSRREARLEIYRHHVLTTLTSALEATFPSSAASWTAASSRMPPTPHPRASADRALSLRVRGQLPRFPRRVPAVPGPPVPARRGAARMGDERRAPRPRRRPDGSGLPRPRGGRGHAAAHVHRRSLGVVPRLPVAGRSDLARQPGRRRAGDPVDLAAGGVRLEVRRAGDARPCARSTPPTTRSRRRSLGGDTLEDAAAAALGVDPHFDLTAALHALLDERIFTASPYPTDKGGPSP